MITNPAKIRVLVVDDSALVRALLTEILSSDAMIEVVGSAADPYAAREKIKQLNPDVLTLDVEMPRMDGVTFLRNLMRLRPMPVVMVSALTVKGGEITLDAMEAGAVDFISKPRMDLEDSLPAYAQEIIAKVKAAASAKPRMLALTKPTRVENFSADVVLPTESGRRYFRGTDKIIAVGASTGGTEAIRELLEQMPMDAPAMVITQHIPKTFSASFAERMNRSSAMAVKEAEEGDVIQSGHVYIAPGDAHLLVVRSGNQYRCTLSDGERVNRHRPSVDVLFRSVAQCAGPNAVGVLLTGMGADGARGLLEMQTTGAFTIAQDQATSVVWGMPGEAVKLGAVKLILPLQKIVPRIRILSVEGWEAAMATEPGVKS